MILQTVRGMGRVRPIVTIVISLALALSVGATAVASASASSKTEGHKCADPRSDYITQGGGGRGRKAVNLGCTGTAAEGKGTEG